jgi:hypothetical protein
LNSGQFDEPVGIAVSANGDVAVADTWNRRVQIFRPDESGLVYSSTGEFSVEAWFGQSLDNKPYLTFSPYGTILISDPEGARILEFTQGGSLCVDGRIFPFQQIFSVNHMELILIQQEICGWQIPL